MDSEYCSATGLLFLQCTLDPVAQIFKQHSGIEVISVRPDQSICSASTLIDVKNHIYISPTKDCFKFLRRTSFNIGQTGDQLIVPTNCLEAWFVKFDSKYKRDPDFLLHSGDKA